MTWLAKREGFVEIAVHVSPGARKTSVAGLHGAALKIRLQAPPVDGKANRALTEFIAEQLGLPRASVALVAGETSREKRVRICGATIEHIRATLSPGA